MVRSFVCGMPSGCTNNSPESRRGLGHVTPIILAVRSAILATAWLLVYLYDFELRIGTLSLFISQLLTEKLVEDLS